ncbi:hypothetical protein [Arthrobacter livingstonensis]|uniref:hypothetical protein n=1 Tax=Arthrobacter livingstonensis TaxID=670078 RepID=UPI001B868CD5|nr:hypothetical protein [Arthrobacter livingstonensis]
MVMRPRLPGKCATRSFTYVEAVSAGATVSRLRARDLHTPSRQIRVPSGVEQTLLDRVRPYTALGESRYISHSTAALLHGIPLPREFEQLRAVHLSRPSSAAIPRRKGVIGHRQNLRDDEVMLLGDIPVTTPARTFLDLAAILRLDDLVAAADHLICEHDRYFEPRKFPIVAEGTLRSYLADKHHVPGLDKARAAVELMRVGADSPRETRLRLILFRAGLPEFTANHVIDNDPGENVVYPDLGCEEFRVCGEYEGEVHQTPEKQLRDRNRDQRTRVHGWLQVKVYNKDMQQGDAYVVAMFTKALRERGWKPRQTP